ncbi:MAG: alpha/beta fold hydrolase [Gemmatimonadaceae bacterium]
MAQRGRRKGRLAPEEMFPAGVAEIRVHRATLPDGLSLRVAVAGGRGSPPILLVHGWGASIYMWRDWFAPLAAQGWRAVAVDLPGHGLSDKPESDGEYRLERQVAVLRALMEVEGIVGAPIVAQSMGGTIALEVALSGGPAIGPLTLVNPAAFGTVRHQRLARFVSPAVVDAFLDRLVPRWIVARAHRMVYGDPSRITPRDVDEYWAPSQFPGYARAMRRLLHEFEWRRAPAGELAARLRRLAHPSLVVLGGRDRLVRDAKPYVAALRAAQAPLILLEVPGGGHAVNEEQPAVVIERVVEFLRQRR